MTSNWEPVSGMTGMMTCISSLNNNIIIMKVIGLFEHHMSHSGCGYLLRVFKQDSSGL